jgi:flagellar basal-body rod modification protein FlgD
MTSPISGVTVTPGTPTPPSQTSGSKIAADKDLFLKLLVAQLKYQDPSKPADSSQFLSQSATFTMVEKLEELTNSQQQLVSAQMMTGATALIGRTVTYTGANGDELSGVVTSATISGSNPTVKVGNTDVALSSVKEVRSTNRP